jgi:hypothetical protein
MGGELARQAGVGSRWAVAAIAGSVDGVDQPGSGSSRALWMVQRPLFDQALVQA